MEAEGEAGRQKEKKRGIQTDRLTDRHTDRQTERQIDRQTYRQTNG